LCFPEIQTDTYTDILPDKTGDEKMDKSCAVYNSANLIGKRWTLLILLELHKGQGKWKRYSEIKKKLPQLTPKMLSMRLKELYKEGMIDKKVDSSIVPIKSEYSLTKRGEEFIGIIKNIKEWTLRWGTFKRCKQQNCKQCEF
jgi:DNA-binding HxlR family transcriptional regulator